MRSRLARAITALALASLGGCIKAPPGGLCGSDGDCGEGYRCTDDAHGGARCMGRCAAGIGLCSDGSVCLTPPASTELVCWFGGRIPIDDPCDSTIDCEPGTVCSLGRCRQACQIGLPPGVDAGPASRSTPRSRSSGSGGPILRALRDRIAIPRPLRDDQFAYHTVIVTRRTCGEVRCSQR
jgi:hypothetical protein